MLAAFLFAAETAESSDTLRLDAPITGAADLGADPTLASPPDGAPLPITAPSTDEPSGNEAPDRIYPADPQSIPATVLAALEQAAEEPLEVELSRLLDALQFGFGESSIQVEPTLRPYAFRLAGRMNVRGGSFRVRVGAYDEALARQRAESLRRLFEAAGVVPGRLQFSPRSGAPGLTAEAS